MVDLSVEIGGVRFKNPIVVGSATPTMNAECMRKGIEGGARHAQALPAEPSTLGSAHASIPTDARAMIILDARLHGLIAPALQEYARAAAQRRGFGVAVLPIAALDDQPPAALRATLQSWHAVRPSLEGVLFVGNIKLPSFFLPRADIHSVRPWPRYFEDLDMVVTQRLTAGTVFGEMFCIDPAPRPGRTPAEALQEADSADRSSRARTTSPPSPIRPPGSMSSVTTSLTAS